MEEEKLKAWNIFKKVFGFIGTLVVLVVCLKCATFFMPFFIAGVLALIIEPIIKFNMNKLRMSRRMSAFIVVIITIVFIISIAIWGGTTAVTKLIDLSKNIPSIISYLSNTFQNVANGIVQEYGEYVPAETADSIINSINGFISNLGGYLQGIVSALLQVALSVPRIIVNVVITILALIFFTKDRVFMIDLLEYHVPDEWLVKLNRIKKEIFHTFGSYIKVYSKILFITFMELLIAFGILNLIGFEFKNIISLSVVIAIIDILPILGVGTVLIPWFIWSFITGETSLGIALLIVYLVILVIRQFIEPKLVSDQLGVHPIITLIAMYTGFKIIGFSGLILGPIALMILRCVYADQIKKGLLKSLVE